MGSIVVISGPVGAGKTTVAKALAAGAAAPAAFIERDDFWFMLSKPKPGGRQANFLTIMRAMFRAAAAMAGDGYEAILDFSMPAWFLEPAVARAPETPVHLVVLRPSLAVCAARAAERAEGAIADYGPYRQLYDTFDVAERHVIDNGELAPADAAAAIRGGLSDARFLFGARQTASSGGTAEP